jgi:hypothetical protein
VEFNVGHGSRARTAFWRAAPFRATTAREWSYLVVNGMHIPILGFGFAVDAVEGSVG